MERWYRCRCIKNAVTQKRNIKKLKEVKNGTEVTVDEVIFNNNNNKTHTHIVTATIFSY